MSRTQIERLLETYTGLIRGETCPVCKTKMYIAGSVEMNPDYIDATICKNGHWHHINANGALERMGE